MSKTREMDLLHGLLLGKLVRFALPIALSSMLQQMFNAVDTSVVGRFADANALAAVGTNAASAAAAQMPGHTVKCRKKTCKTVSF